MSVLKVIMFWQMRTSDRALKNIATGPRYHRLQSYVFVRSKLNSFSFVKVFFEGEFVGGCDILLQMHQSGELVEELGKIGIKSALLNDAPEK